MKKVFLFLFAALLGISCGDDDNDNNDNTGYPTDNLTLRDEKKVLVLNNYAPFSGISISNRIFEIVADNEFGDDLHWINIVTPPNPLSSQPSVDLAAEFGLGTPNDLSLNGIPYSIGATFFEDIAMRLENGRAIASVAHKVTKNDTAWLIDSKVKFWKDTVAANRFKIETYFLADVPAYNYSSIGIDFRMANVTDVIDRADSISSWIISIPSVDSSSQVIRPGDEFVHTNVMFDKATPDSLYGNPIATYTPFGLQFFENDVIGTRSTPIRHSFLRPNNDDITSNDIEFIYTPIFLTVIWSEDPLTGAVDYINSFMSRSTP
jgi:hypothetical protein